jgi:hypothetical protein
MMPAMWRSLLLAVLVLPAAAQGWSYEGHRRLAGALPEPFPQGSCLRVWLTGPSATSAFREKATEPDRWRATDAAEAPRHYLNIDYASPIESYPREWEEAKARFGNYAYKNGWVPWRVEQLYGQLTEAMRARNQAQALDLVAWLSHYVSDAFSPLHCTKNSDPKVSSTDKGLHLRYESDMLAASSQLEAIAQAARGYYGTLGRSRPRDDVFDGVIVGNPLAAALTGWDWDNQGDMAALYAISKDLTARRFGDALTLMASLIGSAWVDAGRPLLTGMAGGCSSEVAQGELALAGYPLPQWPADAGAPPDPEEEEPHGDPPSGERLPPSCAGCGGGQAALLPLLLWGLAWSGRRGNR